MSRYDKFQRSGGNRSGVWRRIFIAFIGFDPLAVSQNVGITSRSVKEKAIYGFFKIEFFNFTVAPYHEIPDESHDK